MSRKLALRFLPLLTLVFLAADTPEKRETQRAALAPLQDFVGVWRGAGQLRRGSTEGAWTEQADWAWKFTEGGAALAFVATTPKYFSGGLFTPSDKEGEYALVAKGVDGIAVQTYKGRLEEGRLVLTAATPKPDLPARVSVRLVAGGDRLVVLYERHAGGEAYTRLAEVGYTRLGSQFGKGAAEVECVVTGGKGTISVMHKGQTYYVCCTGCRDLFQDDPEGVLAEYRARKAAEKEKK